MDKLELDARVARLERRFSLLLTVPFLILALLGVAAVSLSFLARSSRPAVTITTPAVRAPMPPVPPPIGSDAWSKAGMDYLDAGVRKAHDLQSDNSIDMDDFTAIKKSLLNGLSRVDDVARDVQLAKKLLTEGLITSEEYADLRKKILGIDH